MIELWLAIALLTALVATTSRAGDTDVHTGRQESRFTRQIQDVLPNGAVVFTRVGAGGEADLFYYRVGTGLVEIGSDVPSIAGWNKVVNASSTSSKVVF